MLWAQCFLTPVSQGFRHSAEIVVVDGSMHFTPAHSQVSDAMVNWNGTLLTNQFRHDPLLPAVGLVELFGKRGPMSSTSAAAHGEHPSDVSSPVGEVDSWDSRGSTRKLSHQSSFEQTQEHELALSSKTTRYEKASESSKDRPAEVGDRRADHDDLVIKTERLPPSPKQAQLSYETTFASSIFMFTFIAMGLLLLGSAAFCMLRIYSTRKTDVGFATNYAEQCLDEQAFPRVKLSSKKGAKASKDSKYQRKYSVTWSEAPSEAQSDVEDDDGDDDVKAVSSVKSNRLVESNLLLLAREFEKRGRDSSPEREDLKKEDDSEKNLTF